MTEQDAWTLMAAYTNNNALYFLGNILAVWLGFHIANRISQSRDTTVIVRLLATRLATRLALSSQSPWRGIRDRAL